MNLRVLVFGHPARGDPDDPPLNRVTGEGRVHEKPGQYADALSKGISTELYVTESTGAFSAPLNRCLRQLGKASTWPPPRPARMTPLSTASRVPRTPGGAD